MKDGNRKDIQVKDYGKMMVQSTVNLLPFPSQHRLRFLEYGSKVQTNYFLYKPIQIRTILSPHKCRVHHDICGSLRPVEKTFMSICD